MLGALLYTLFCVIHTLLSLTGKINVLCTPASDPRIPLSNPGGNERHCFTKPQKIQLTNTASVPPHPNYTDLYPCISTTEPDCIWGSVFSLGFPEQGSHSLNGKSSADTTEMRKVLEHSASGKRRRERPLFSLETRREGRTLLEVFNFIGVGEQKGKNQTLLRGVEHQRHPPETKGAPFSTRRILDPGRESQRSHGISTLVDLPNSIGQGLWQPRTPLSSMASDVASGGSQTSIGPL